MIAVPIQEPGRVVYGKVAQDLCSGIPLSIWWGTLASVGFCILLLGGILGLAVTAVLRGWHWGVRLPLHATWITLQVLARHFELR